MPEENQIQNEQKNTVATVGMVFSIVWLVALITILFARLWLPLLFVWFILWIIGLFYKPRGKARVAICIPLVVFIAIFSVIAYVWSSVKIPATQFADWIKVEFENFDEESFENERFNAITNEEFNNIFSSLTEEEFETLLETSTWSNMLEKWSYVIFGLLQQGFETSLERYNNWDYAKIDDTENQPITIDIENEDNSENSDEEPSNTEIESESVEVFTESEKNDIEQIIDILE